jgi:hypothetical protein
MPNPTTQPIPTARASNHGGFCDEIKGSTNHIYRRLSHLCHIVDLGESGPGVGEGNSFEGATSVRSALFVLKDASCIGPAIKK